MNRFDAIAIPLLWGPERIGRSVARYIVPITGTLRWLMWLVPPRHLSPSLDRQCFFFFRDRVGPLSGLPGRVRGAFLVRSICFFFLFFYLGERVYHATWNTSEKDELIYRVMD